MGKIGRRGPHKERKKRIADERERERISAYAKREFRRQAYENKAGKRGRKLSIVQSRQLLAAGIFLASCSDYGKYK